MTPEQNKTIHRVISVFGAPNQKMQTVEELMELQKALFENVHRGTDNRPNIVEEMADVEIMLAQMKEVFGIKEEELDKVKDYKLGRLNITIDKYLAKQRGTTTPTVTASKQTKVQIDRVTSNGRV